MATTVTLFCEVGQHPWERKSQRGRRPRSCPEHVTKIERVGSEPFVNADGDEARFSEAQLCQDTVLEKDGIPNPTVQQLSQALQKNGPDGILESARHLPEEQYSRLEELAKNWAPERKARNRRG